MASVKFDNTEIVGTTYIPRYAKHESAPNRILNTMALSREDGEIMISQKYGNKTISLTGYLTASSKANLETAIDSFKELFSRIEKNLDIEWAGGTRRYVATCQSHNFDRDYFHLLFVPWTAEFVVSSGVGEDTTETALENNTFTAWTKTGSWALAGSAKPKPRIRVGAFGATATKPCGIEIKNTDTGERFVMTRANGLDNGKYFEMDCRLKTAKYDSVEDVFYGVFPSWIVGTNNYKITVGEIIDQAKEVIEASPLTFKYIYGNNEIAQSFMVPNSDDTYQVIELYLAKAGTPPNDLTIRIETDNNGKPSGTLVAVNSTFTIAKGDVTGSWLQTRKASTGLFSLVANTRYWIVAKTTAGDSSNYFLWGFEWNANANYSKGNMAWTADAGSTWTDEALADCDFRLYYGGEQDGSKTYKYYIDYYKRYL